MNQVAVLSGAMHYEFRMQIRRRGLWIMFICLTLLISGLFRGIGASTFVELLLNPLHDAWPTEILEWTGHVSTFFPIAVGVLLADRLSRDRQVGVDELFVAMPGALSARLLGKYLGSIGATLVLPLAYYIIGVGCVLYQSGDARVLPFALATFAASVLPGIAFISAFSIACPAILWVPLYQFLFIGYWFWGNLLSPGVGIPTLSHTLLTPIGDYIRSGLFGDQRGAVTQISMLLGFGSMFVLLGVAVLVLLVLWKFLRWQQARM
ncbi:MAG: hypothetical protein M3Z08_00005 [Chloroflexota bacterium]|nr:hypothetical protein [Chloroflexota bacterium]